jgi:hypothetical protein
MVKLVIMISTSNIWLPHFSSGAPTSQVLCLTHYYRMREIKNQLRSALQWHNVYNTVHQNLSINS